MKQFKIKPLVIICILSMAGCASISVSEVKHIELPENRVEISARADRGATEDIITIIVDGKDVVSGKIGKEQATGTIIEGSYKDYKLKAHCSFRWKPGFHISYRCLVYIDEYGPVELEF